MKYTYTILIALLFSQSLLASELKLRDKYAVDWFAESCLKHAKNTEKLVAWAKSRGVPELPKQLSQAWGKDNNAKGWLASNTEGEYIIISKSDGSCTVFARKADAKSLRKYFVETLDYLYKKDIERKVTEKNKKLSRGSLLTTHYILTKKGSKKSLHIHLSTSNSTVGNYQAAMSTKFCENCP